MTRVILKRGDTGDREWAHRSYAEAERRAATLADLHGCQYDYKPADEAFVVNAEFYYAKKERK